MSAAGWIPCASSRSSWRACCSSRSVSVRSSSAGGSTWAAEELQAHPQGEEPLLRAVVEIALESPSLVVAGTNDAGARLLKLDELGAELGLQPAFSSASRAAEPAAARSAGWSTRSRSWTITASRSPTYVACRPSAGGRRSGSPTLVHPCPAIGQPEPDLQRRVADGACERLPHLPRFHLVQLHDDVADVAARSLDEEQPREPDHAEHEMGHDDHGVLLDFPARSAPHRLLGGPRDVQIGAWMSPAIINGPTDRRAAGLTVRSLSAKKTQTTRLRSGRARR